MTYTQERTVQASQQPQTKGYVNAWSRQGGKVKVSGNVRITPEALQFLLKGATTDDQGYLNLDFVLFQNDRARSDRSPDMTGYLQLPRSQAPGPVSDQSRPAAPPKQHNGNATTPDYDEIPF